MAFRFVSPRIDVGDGIEDFSGAKLSFFDKGTSNAKTTFSDEALSVANTDPVIADADGLFTDIWLDVSASATLKSSNDVVIWGPLDFLDPGDSIAALAASLVTVLDSGGNFTATDVEATLAEIATGWLDLDATNTISADQTFSSAKLAMADNIVERPILTDYGITHNVVSSSGGSVTLNLTTGNSFITTLTENISAVILSNPPATGTYGQIVIRIIQDSGGGAFTVTWPASVIWPSGTAPTITVTNNAIDEVTLHTIDAGTTWLGNFSQAFA